MMSTSTRRSVFITGGTRALGEAVVRRFLTDGYSVSSTWIVDRERDPLLDTLDGDREVTANIVAPTTMDTPATRKAIPDADHSASVTPDEVASSIAFLASEPARELRDAWLPIYGSA